MGAVYFDSEFEYIDSVKSLKERIARIDNIIEALESAALKIAVTRGNLQEYSVDDGQVKIRTVYKDATSVAASINNFENIKARLVSKLKKDRTFRLMDGKNFKGRCNGRIR